MGPVHAAAKPHLKWLEDDLSELGCTPSCSRQVYEMTLALATTMPLGTYLASQPVGISNT